MNFFFISCLRIFGIGFFLALLMLVRCLFDEWVWTIEADCMFQFPVSFVYLKLSGVVENCQNRLLTVGSFSNRVETLIMEQISIRTYLFFSFSFFLTNLVICHFWGLNFKKCSSFLYLMFCVLLVTQPTRTVVMCNTTFDHRENSVLGKRPCLISFGS